ncbi:MAG TPA: hypothetical protein VI072_36240 [Polyangiaceae bacterium]
MLHRRRALFAVVVLLLAVVAGYALTSREGADGGSGGENSLDRRWDPSGSHPLPNEGVQRAP